MKILRYIYVLIMSCMFACMQTLAEGIVVGTHVATPHGLQAIEALEVGDYVICYDFQQSSQQRIAHISKHISRNVIQLSINHHKVAIDGEQRFYLPLEKTWCKAYQLMPGQVLLALTPDSSIDATCNHYCVIEDIHELHGLYVVHDLTIPYYHNFCITQLGLVTHNVAILAPVAAVASVVGAKIAAFLSVFACSTPIALTSAQATTAAAATTLGIGASLISDRLKAKRACKATQNFPSYTPKSSSPSEAQSNINKVTTSQVTNTGKKEPIVRPQPAKKDLSVSQKQQSAISVKKPSTSPTSIRKVSHNQCHVFTPTPSHHKHIRADSLEQKKAREQRKASCATLPSNQHRKTVPFCRLTPLAQPSTPKTPCTKKTNANIPGVCHLDHGNEIGTHINVKDYRKGKGDKGENGGSGQPEEPKKPKKRQFDFKAS